MRVMHMRTALFGVALLMRSALQVFHNTVRPLLVLAGVEPVVEVTRFARHALYIAENYNPERFEGILFLSGDGVVHEFVNAMLRRCVVTRSRLSCAPAADTHPIVRSRRGLATLRRTAFAVAPLGSQNALAVGLGLPSVYNAVFCLIKVRSAAALQHPCVPRNLSHSGPPNRSTRCAPWMAWWCTTAFPASSASGGSRCCGLWRARAAIAVAYARAWVRLVGVGWGVPSDMVEEYEQTRYLGPLRYPWLKVRACGVRCAYAQLIPPLPSAGQVGLLAAARPPCQPDLRSVGSAPGLRQRRGECG